MDDWKFHVFDLVKSIKSILGARYTEMFLNMCQVRVTDHIPALVAGGGGVASRETSAYFCVWESLLIDDWLIDHVLTISTP